MISFKDVRRFFRFFSPSRKREITRQITRLLRENPEGMTAHQVWQAIEKNVDDYENPRYTPLTEIYGILVHMRDRKKAVYNRMTKNPDFEGRVLWLLT